MSFTGRNSWLVCLLCAVALTTACSTQASIYRTDGSLVRGQILRTEDGIHVVRTHADGSLDTLEIPVDDVAKIYHPGQTEALTGSIFSAIGLGLITVGVVSIINVERNAREADPNYPLANEGSGLGYLFAYTMFTMGGGLVLGGGAAAVWGFPTWSDSRKKAKPRVTLTASPTPHGGGLGSRFVTN